MNIIGFIDNIKNNKINSNSKIIINFGKILFDNCFNKKIKNYLIIKNIIDYLNTNFNDFNIEKKKYSLYSYNNKYLIIFNNNINYVFTKKYINNYTLNFNEHIDLFVSIYDHLSLHNDSFEPSYEYDDIIDIYKVSYIFNNNVEFNILKINNEENNYQIQISFTDFNSLNFIKKLINDIIIFF